MSASDAKLRWRCRRGMRELDQLLGWYLEARYPRAEGAERDAFTALLDEPDPELWCWLMGNGRPQRADWCAIIDEIRAGDRV